MSSLHRLGFTGDIMLGGQVDETYQESNKQVAALWGDVESLLRGLDGRFVSLDCCLSTEMDRQPGRPSHHRAAAGWATAALRLADIDCCTLANDHTMEFGPEGLDETRAALSAADIATVGAGASAAAAREPTAVDCRGLTVAVIAFTDATSGDDAATEDRAGVAHVSFDPDDEQAMRTLADAVSATDQFGPALRVASLHWGDAGRTEPTDRQRAVARHLAEWGIDIIHGHGAGVFQGVEVINAGGSPTVVCYDTGTFIRDSPVDPVDRNDRSFLFELVVGGDRTPVELICHPTEIDSGAVYSASKRGATWCRRTMQERSDRFGTVFSRTGNALVCSLS